jgi:hypothetical protein
LQSQKSLEWLAHCRELSFGSPAILVGSQQSLAIHFVSVAVDGAYFVLADAGSKDPVALKDQLDDFVVAILGGDDDHATNSRQSLIPADDPRSACWIAQQSINERLNDVESILIDQNLVEIRRISFAFWRPVSRWSTRKRATKHSATVWWMNRGKWPLDSTVNPKLWIWSSNGFSKLSNAPLSPQRNWKSSSENQQGELLVELGAGVFEEFFDESSKWTGTVSFALFLVEHLAFPPPEQFVQICQIHPLRKGQVHDLHLIL